EASLATSWDVSEDLRTYTFHLREGARWSNGRAITAWDVAYQVIRVVHPLTASPNGEILATLKNAVGYLGRRVFALQRPVGPYQAGEIVERAAKGEVARIDVRTSSRELALRDLGAGAGAAYARVPAGREVHHTPELFLRCSTWKIRDIVRLVIIEIISYLTGYSCLTRSIKN
ncbi:MAG: ABC transporter substrate-binding protein, partial [Ignavibacteriales bacterium]